MRFIYVGVALCVAIAAFLILRRIVTRNYLRQGSRNARSQADGMLRALGAIQRFREQVPPTRPELAQHAALLNEPLQICAVNLLVVSRIYEELRKRALSPNCSPISAGTARLWTKCSNRPPRSVTDPFPSSPT